MSDELFKVSKQYPLPPDRINYKELLENLKPGESMLIASETNRVAFQRWANKMGIKIQSHKGKDGLRIWRMK